MGNVSITASTHRGKLARTQVRRTRNKTRAASAVPACPLSPWCANTREYQFKQPIFGESEGGGESSTQFESRSKYLPNITYHYNNFPNSEAVPTCIPSCPVAWPNGGRDKSAVTSRCGCPVAGASAEKSVERNWELSLLPTIKWLDVCHRG